MTVLVPISSSVPSCLMALPECGSACVFMTNPNLLRASHAQKSLQTASALIVHRHEDRPERQGTAAATARGRAANLDLRDKRRVPKAGLNDRRRPHRQGTVHGQQRASLADVNQSN